MGNQGNKIFPDNRGYQERCVMPLFGPSMELVVAIQLSRQITSHRVLLQKSSCRAFFKSSLCGTMFRKE